MANRVCKNGHSYDDSKYSACPLCGSTPDYGDATVKAYEDDYATHKVDYGSSVETNSYNAFQKTEPAGYSYPTEGRSRGGVSENNKTVRHFKEKLGVDPVVGWLVCVEGGNLGEDFRLIAGRNFIGRARSMDVCISKDETVSRERHAIVSYEPKKNIYVVQPGDSKELFYINDNVVLSPVQIHPNDILEVGETKLMFIPCCSEKFTWE